MSPRLTLAALCFALGAGPALAQGPAQTGTGGGPASTIYAPNTTSVGQTKPPGSAAAPETPAQQEDRTAQQKRDDKIMQGICIGCGVK